jgi:hypothetical protein
VTGADLLVWAEVGAKLVTVLGVPIASVIRLFRESGGTEEELMELIGKWAALITNVAARIAFLKAAVAALEG